MNHGQRMFREASQRAQDSMRRVQDDIARRALQDAAHRSQASMRRAEESTRRTQEAAVRQAQEKSRKERYDREARRPNELYPVWRRGRASQSSSETGIRLKQSTISTIQANTTPKRRIIPTTQTNSPLKTLVIFLKRMVIFTAILAVLAGIVILAAPVLSRNATTSSYPRIEPHVTTPVEPATIVKYVKSPKLNIRKAPGDGQPFAGGALPEGTPVTLLGESKTVDDGGIWVLVRADNVTGWVNQKHLK